MERFFVVLNLLGKVLKSSAYCHLDCSKLCCFSGLIGKVEQELPNDPTMKRARYRVIIDEVLQLKNSTGSLSARSAVISVPNVKALTCPCTSFPKFKFVLLGKVVLDSSESATELNIIVKRPAVVRKWNKELVKKLRKSCAKYFTDLETAE